MSNTRTSFPSPSPAIQFNADPELDQLANVLFTACDDREAVNFKGRSLFIRLTHRGLLKPICPGWSDSKVKSNGPNLAVSLHLQFTGHAGHHLSPGAPVPDAMSLWLCWTKHAENDEQYVAEVMYSLNLLLKGFTAKIICAAMDTFRAKYGWSWGGNAHLVQAFEVTQCPLGTGWPVEKCPPSYCS